MSIGRIVGERMRASLGQPIVIENVAGANGSIGVGRAARAANDGYTLVMGLWNTHVANGALFGLSYDVVKDFEPIALIASNPLLIDAKKAMPATSLQELVVWLKANPDKASQGTSALAARVTSSAFYSRTLQARVSSFCTTGVPVRRCRIWWQAFSTS